MRMLVRKDPFLREMAAWRNAMDHALEETTEQPYWNRTGSWALALDVAETEDYFLVKASIPGINPNDLEITLTDNVLTIKGEIEENQEIEGRQMALAGAPSRHLSAQHHPLDPSRFQCHRSHLCGWNTQLECAQSRGS